MPDQRIRTEQRTVRALKDIWPQYLETGYFDSAGNLKLEYVSRSSVSKLSEAMVQCHNGLTSNQVRRFFGHARQIEARLRSHTRSDANRWSEVAPSLYKLDIAAADALAKDKIPQLFHDFVQANVQAIKSQSDFLSGFLPHFEALIGFGSRHFRDERRS